MAKKMSKKKMESTVSRLFAKACSGITIDIFDIGKVMAVGVESLKADGDEGMAEAAIVSYVELIRKN